MTPTSPRRRRTKVRHTRGRRTGAVLGWVLLGCVAIVAVAGVWTAVDALRVRDQLVEAASVVPQLEDQVLAGDDEAVAASVETLRDAASSAVTTTSRPHWTLTSWLPGVGPNVRAVQTLAGTVSDLAEGPLPSLPAVVAAASPAALAPQDGRVDVQSVAEAAPVVIAADDGVNAAIDSLAAIDRSALLPQVSDAVDQLSSELVDLRFSTATASRAVQLIPPMMGIDGPREYLVLVQNNAEPRALGGIVGSVLVLRAEEGTIELTQQVAGNSLVFDEPVGNLTPAETELFGTQLGRYMLNVSSTPDFPRAASIAASMWLEKYGTEVDGVLSVDPVALGYMLDSAGPVVAPSGVQLDSDNAANYLLNQIYIDIPEPSEQDVFFAEAASAIFESLTSGELDSEFLVGDLGRAVAESRLLLWSSHPPEQELLAPTALSGGFHGTESHTSVIRVDLNDGTGAKAGFYLNAAYDLELEECRPDGSQALLVTATLTSDLPTDILLPSYVSGGGNFVPEGVIQTNVLTYSPPLGSIVSIESNGEELAVFRSLWDGRDVAVTTVALEPGETSVLSYRIVTAPHAPISTALATSPGSMVTSTPSNVSC